MISKYWCLMILRIGKKKDLHKQFIDLTLSGHTHGMQFGIEIPYSQIGPIKYRYKYWSLSKIRQIVVVGFGLAYPGRVGIYPEISIINLRRLLMDNKLLVYRSSAGSGKTYTLVKVIWLYYLRFLQMI